MLGVPLLVYVLDFPIKEAIAASLWIVLAVSLVVLIYQQAWQHLRWKMLGFFMLGGMLGSFSGTRLGMLLPDLWLTVMFALLVLFVAWWMQRPKPKSELDQGFTCRCALTFFAGVLSGLLTGMLGVGGGFLMVPMLILLGVSNYHDAVAHSLVLIVVNAMIGALGYIGHVSLSIAPMLWVAGLAAVGGLAGSLLSRRLSVTVLQQAFSVMLALLGSSMLLQAAWTH